MHATRLRDSLERCGVLADVQEGYGIALVSICADLLVWCDGFVYRWWAGQTFRNTGRRLYVAYGVDNPATVARCVADRYDSLRRTHPLSELMTRTR
ncbi:hypothetical protein [Streptosporangium sp. KLBMP 9127]|nr:hypothetical protein [Streptosporangium sp. KLBMP 9127]